ncbi:MAG: hypothetical protein MR522_01895 [Trueperella sp.]|uniref:hypothetical protein n=1 Tax=Trueperella TaxID=1069494 RepID=UPI0025EEFBC1|nr:MULTISPECIES: hypothetical protein [Trueperella]MCI7305009.1 hypothetical protein [Trueperella sp.]MDY5404016.1 hypothetical protein [Trueperella sp.]
MTLHIYQPTTLAQRNEARTLAGAGLMIDIGEIGYVGVDLCKTATSRARLLAMRKPGKVFVRESALFVHTGWHTPQLQTRVDAVAPAAIAGTDLADVGGQLVTTLERTAIDLMISHEDAGVELLCLLVRAGTCVQAIERRAYQLQLHGIARVREILTQLPRDLGQPASLSL